MYEQLPGAVWADGKEGEQAYATLALDAAGGAGGLDALGGGGEYATPLETTLLDVGDEYAAGYAAVGDE